MRKFLFLLLFLSGSIRAFALYNGNSSLPMMPESGAFIPREAWVGVKVGYEFDFVYDRRLRMQGQHLDHCNKKVHKFDSLSNYGVLTLNFSDRVEIFSTLGVMSCELSHTPFANTKITYRTDNAFAWGVGGRAILAYWGDIQVSVNAAYLQSTPSLSTLRVNNRTYSTYGTEFDYNEWQIGIGVSYRFSWFIPYIGADFSNFRTRIEDLDSIRSFLPSRHATFKDVFPCGIFLGFGLSPDRAFAVNFEARFINENAVSVSADCKF